MNTKSVNQISTLQFILIVFEIQIGSGVLSTPRELAQEVGRDGWISILLGALVSILSSIAIIKVMEKNPDKGLHDLLALYFGKWIGGFLSIVWMLYAMLIAAVVITFPLDIIRIWILPQTKDYILMIFFAVPIYMVVKRGLVIIARYSEFVAFMTWWLPLLIVYAMFDIHLIHILPIGKSSFKDMLSSLFPTVFCFGGFDIALFLYPYLKNKKQALKGILIANVLTLLSNLLFVVGCTLKFGPDEILTYAYPSLNLLKLIHFQILERFEIIFLCVYVTLLIMPGIPYLYTVVVRLTQFAGNKHHHLFLTIILLSMILLLYFHTPTDTEYDILKKAVSISLICLGYLFPIFMWLWTSLMKPGKESRLE